MKIIFRYIIFKYDGSGFGAAGNEKAYKKLRELFQE
jgi:hypothetical protein